MPRTGRPKTPLELTGEEREQLARWVRRAKSSQALALRCRIILACGEGLDKNHFVDDRRVRLSQLSRGDAACSPSDDPDVLVVEAAEGLSGANDFLHVLDDEGGMLLGSHGRALIGSSIAVRDDEIDGEESNIEGSRGERVGVKGAAELEWLAHHDQASGEGIAGV